LTVNALDEARRTVGLSCADLWWRYFALGGNAEPIEVDGYLQGLFPMEAKEHNFLALALNEAFLEQGLDHPLGYREVPPP
jgi:hypothetical protein